MAPFLVKWIILPSLAYHLPQTILPTPSFPHGKPSKNLWNNKSALPFLPNSIFCLNAGSQARANIPHSQLSSLTYGTVASTFRKPLVPMVNVASYCSYPNGNPSGCETLFDGVTDPANPTAKSVADFTAYVTPLRCK